MDQPVLVVEDNLNWREQLTSILRDEGYAVETASDYVEALGQLRRRAFDLLVVDLRLSDADETNRKGMGLLNDAYERQIPTIIVTGYGTSELAEEAYHEYGVYDFISKGNFDSGRFRESVKQAIAIHQARRRPKALTPEQKRRFDETIRKIFRGEAIKFEG